MREILATFTFSGYRFSILTKNGGLWDARPWQDTPEEIRRLAWGRAYQWLVLSFQREADGNPLTMRSGPYRKVAASVTDIEIWASNPKKRLPSYARQDLAVSAFERGMCRRWRAIAYSHSPLVRSVRFLE